MTRLIVILSAGLMPIASVAVAQANKAPITKSCATPNATVIDGKKPQIGIHKLGEEPPAHQYLAVLRTLDGCPVPVVLRRGPGVHR
ncbi:hypothetical protein [Sphingomonas oligophenolica]|uniref:hypothetical protein n=1 Tax=Sphingomonas oligophenolica TaxID=301154 RepID=UPI00112DD796|nr:hypothetical protein [Sphingomonas oligophenolica]